MKILTKEEEEAHYQATLQGGLIGGGIGIVAGVAAVTLGSMRFPIIRHLTLPMKAFLVTSTGTFAAITRADAASQAFDHSRHPGDQYQDTASKALAAHRAGQTSSERAIGWAREHRYYIVGGSWVASMGIALSLVSRSPLTIAQKLVQARVYAQGLTLAVLIATAAFEISDQRNDQGRYETVQTFDAEDPTHMKTIERKVHREEYQGEDQWKDMVEAEERRLKQRDEQLKEYEAEHHKKLHKKSKMDDQHDKHDDQDKGAGKDGQKDGEKK